MRKKIIVPPELLKEINLVRKKLKKPPVKFLWWTGLEDFQGGKTCPLGRCLGVCLSGDSRAKYLYFTDRSHYFSWNLACFIWNLPYQFEA